MRLSDIYSHCLLPKRATHVYKMGVFRALCPLWPASGVLRSFALPEAVVILFLLPLALLLDITPPEIPLCTSPPQSPSGEAFPCVFRGACNPLWMSHSPHFPSFMFFFLSESPPPSRHMATCFLGSPLAESSLCIVYL